MTCRPVSTGLIVIFLEQFSVPFFIISFILNVLQGNNQGYKVKDFSKAGDLIKKPEI